MHLCLRRINNHHHHPHHPHPHQHPHHHQHQHQREHEHEHQHHPPHPPPPHHHHHQHVHVSKASIIIVVRLSQSVLWHACCRFRVIGTPHRHISCNKHTDHVHFWTEAPPSTLQETGNLSPAAILWCRAGAHPLNE